MVVFSFQSIFAMIVNFIIVCDENAFGKTAAVFVL